MQKSCRGLLLLLIICLLSACAFLSGFTAEEVQKRIDEAREYHNAVKGLETDEVQSADYQQAGAFLAAAESRFRMGRRKAAAASAEKSLALSKKILSRYYNDNIARLARKVRNELEIKSQGDPDSPLTDYIPRVEGILTYAQKVRGEPHIVRLEKVLSDLEDVLQITRTVRSNQSRTLSSDISFRAGEYRLSEQGKETVRLMIGDMLENLKNFINEKGTTLNIRIVGYTDQLNFGRGTGLVADLTEGVKEGMPGQEPARRIFLNQRLSLFRAENIGNYIREQMEKNGPGKLPDGVNIRVDTMGRGEQIPSGLSSPYPVSDTRRRICKIHVYITNP